MRDIMRDYFGIIIPDDRLIWLLLSDQAAAELIQNPSSDTADRDIMIDAIVVDVLGPQWHWPLLGDSRKFKDEFRKKFYSTAIEKGYQFIYGPEK